MVTGAPFFFDDGEGAGASPASGVLVALDEGIGESPGLGVGDGEGLCFFFEEGLGEDSGAGVGEDLFFPFAEADALGSVFSTGKRLPEAPFFFREEGDGDFSGVADRFGARDFSASSFFFGAFELLRCFRGVGVGVGTKIFLILLPNDSSACARSAPPRSIAVKRKVLAILLTRRMERQNSTTMGKSGAVLRPVIPSRADGEGPHKR
jgi:hypothetical protein